jgi:hypothetical protein
MTAQPLDPHDGLTRVHLPRTIKAIRAALPIGERARFAAELDDSEAGGLAVVVERWWTRAVVWSSPSTIAKLDAYDAGEWHGLPVAEVLGDRWAA